MAKVVMVEAKTMQFMLDENVISFSNPFCEKNYPTDQDTTDFKKQSISHTLNFQAVCVTPILLKNFEELSKMTPPKRKLFKEPKLQNYFTYQDLNLPPPK
ncbi:hypothetical protein [Haloflavibacter putidus]|uniref:Uncharacterized protein n=1 Tax=Haloflavibacter putidus TaxID=2576776 RepID=A0A508A0S0_9FLAO|nr:hypothetical protein [Haloflavibacter putidus]TQD39422.1 hypothetical protein FKR84_05870 [Haloflavibacter putidus]